MFLATTPNQKYWNNNEKIIFLGEWCKLYSQKEKWDKLDYQTFPHHWENRDEFYRDLSYTKSLYEKYLKQLDFSNKILSGLFNLNFFLKYQNNLFFFRLSSLIILLIKLVNLYNNPNRLIIILLILKSITILKRWRL